MERRECKSRKWEAAAVYLAMAVMFIIAGLMAARGTALFVTGSHVENQNDRCIVIDAGHGGDDPGKIGINGALEKDINLRIAKKVAGYLEMEGIQVVMTRTDGEGLYDSEAQNKKVQDMKRRIVLIEETAPIITVSIHQNSYPEEYVKGAQVFYYKDSADSCAAAEIMQKSLIKRLDPENKREAKANASYYLLKKTSSPVIIVECGFLSNSEEAEKLNDDTYQEKVAWAVYMGIMQYINQQP